MSSDSENLLPSELSLKSINFEETISINFSFLENDGEVTANFI